MARIRLWHFVDAVALRSGLDISDRSVIATTNGANVVARKQLHLSLPAASWLKLHEFEIVV